MNGLRYKQETEKPYDHCVRNAPRSDSYSIKGKKIRDSALRCSRKYDSAISAPFKTVISCSDA